MNTTITTSQIFDANQILTIDIAKNLTGKTIAVTSPEYKANKPTVRIFKVLGLETQFDAAINVEIAGGKYANQQEMWIKENNQRAIEWAKKRTVFVYEGNDPCATVEEDNYCLEAGTFFGSDADREVYFIELN